MFDYAREGARAVLALQYTTVDLEEVFIEARRNGDLALIELCLASELIDMQTQTNLALLSACSNGHFEVVKKLLDVGADVHVQNDYLLKDSSERGFVEIVKILLEEGADVHAQNDYVLRYASMDI